VKAKLIDGSGMGKVISEEVSRAVSSSFQDDKPKLANLAVGDDDPSSRVYINSQIKAAKRVGIEYEQVLLPIDTDEKKIINKLKEMNRDQSINGIILQRPLPASIDPYRILQTMDPEKDVEGMHPENLGAIVHGRQNLIPCTASAAVRLFKSLNIPAMGLEVVIVGHSEIVGKPISLLLLQDLATTTVCHIGTKDLKSHTVRADLLFVAAGVPGLIQAEMIKPGAIVIDIGINRIKAEKGSDKKSRIVGDVDFEKAVEIAGYITPVPGGVGPVTTAILMENTLKAALKQKGMT